MFTQKQIAWLSKNVHGLPFSEVAKAFNEKFGTRLNRSQIQFACNGRGIKNGLAHNGYTSKQRQWLKVNVVYCSFHELTDRFNAKFGTSKSYKTLKRFCLKNGFKNGLLNYSDVLAESIRGDGYTHIKTQDTPPIWRHKHAVIWEGVNGKVPAGHKIIFADGNKQNFDIENLVLVTNAELAYLNRKGLIYNDTDLTKTALALTKLTLKINEKTRKLGNGV